MKRFVKLVTVLCLVVSFYSCKKDNKDSGNVISEKYFTIENATFVNNSFPEASSNAPVINSVLGNSTVLEGGSNPITINTNATIKEVLIGVDGKSGYYKLDASHLKSTGNYLLYLLFSQNFEQDNFGILVAIIDNLGNISESQTINVSKITAGTGKLQVSCSWNKANDLDLHLVEPNGSEIYWETDTSANGGELDVDSNPICMIDNINNENITYSGNAKVEKGNYVVRISLFSSCDVTEKTDFVVTARLDGNLIQPVSGANPYYGSVAASHSYIDGNGPREGDTVMIFNVPNTKSLYQKVKMLKFSYPKKINEVKKSMVKE